jgi:pimeloyl-ACP methyl ester carboxylesterase
MPGMRAFRNLVLLATAFALAGCVSSILAKKVVSPPNQSGIKALFADTEIVKRAPQAFTEVWKVRAPGPAADIAVASIEPGDYSFEYDLQLSYPEGRNPVIDRFNAFWRPAAARTPRGVPKQTIVVLHGYLQDKRFLTPWALRLAQAGYRCAVVDLRGHGESTGKHIGFGAFEAADISAVIDDLGRRGWDVSRVGLFGVSYGASVALLTAGRDPRVKAVVAFEPFSSAEQAVPELMRSAFASRARGITDRQFADAYVKEAKIAGFDWKDADIPAALKRTTAPVLFLHGEADTWLSPEHSRRLAAMAPPGSRLRLAPRDNHVTLPLQIAPFESDVIGWFDEAFMKP